MYFSGHWNIDSYSENDPLCSKSFILKKWLCEARLVIDQDFWLYFSEFTVNGMREMSVWFRNIINDWRQLFNYTDKLFVIPPFTEIIEILKVQIVQKPVSKLRFPRKTKVDRCVWRTLNLTYFWISWLFQLYW